MRCVMHRQLVLAVASLALAAGAAGAQQPPPPAPVEPLPPGAVIVDGPAPAPNRLWGEVEFLVGWLRSYHVPALVTASPPGTPRDQAGVLGAPGTTVLFGDERVNGGDR